MRSRIGMVFALLALLVGGIGLYNHMTAQPQQQNPTVSQPSNSDEPQAHYVQVWRAKSNLERGTPIEIDDVQKEQMLLNIALEEGINSDIKLDFSPSTLLSKNIEAGKSSSLNIKLKKTILVISTFSLPKGKSRILYW